MIELSSKQMAKTLVGQSLGSAAAAQVAEYSVPKMVFNLSKEVSGVTVGEVQKNWKFRVPKFVS